jgi:hypothetical protein
MVFTMTEKQKQEYDAPMVELIEARVEKGFQGSFTGTTEGVTNGTERMRGSGHNYDNTLFT